MINSDKDDSKKPGDDLPDGLKDFLKKLGGVSIPIPGMHPDAGPAEPAEDEESNEEILDRIFDFHYTPREIKAHLDRFVIRQDEAKKALAIAVCDHYNHAKYLRGIEKENGKLPQGVEFQKQNVMVVGPTGVGKTYLIKHIAELMGVPFVKADATKFSETGYVGGDVDDLVRDLVTQANGDVELAEYGIIYIDEIDKLASRSSHGGRDVSGRGVQTTLLKLMEETEVSVRNPMDMRGQMQAMMDMQRGGKKQKSTVNTRHILFIVSGAFSGLEKIVEGRTRSARMGFQADLQPSLLDEEVFQQVTTQDFIDYGFEAEFIGRLPVRVICEKLSEGDFVKIMKESEGSLLRQYEREFDAYGITAKFEDSAIQRIAQLAAEENTGARALMTVTERLLRDFKYELPGTDVAELAINSDLINNAEEEVARYRKMARKIDVKRTAKKAATFAREFEDEHGVVLSFDSDALSALAELSVDSGQSVLQICRQRFRDFQHGLKLVRKNTGLGEFVLPERAVMEPDAFLSDLVVKSYRKSDAENPGERDEAE